MNPARIVFPGFWFGKTSLVSAKEWARRGVGGFCVYGGTAQETKLLIEELRRISPYDHLLFCADIEEDLSEVITDAPVFPANIDLGKIQDPEQVYRKGFLSARLARSIGINWLFAPVVDIGYSRPAFGEQPLLVSRLCGDYAAGLANGGVLNCIKYFPGLNGILKTLAQMEDAEFLPYKHMFCRADAVMPSDMVFGNIDPANRAVMSEKIIKELLKKRLNYKGCVISTPLFKSKIKHEASAVLKMIASGVEMIAAPKDPSAVIEAITKEFAKGSLVEELIHAVSNLELCISKILTNTATVTSVEDALAQANQFKK